MVLHSLLGSMEACKWTDNGNYYASASFKDRFQRGKFSSSFISLWQNCLTREFFHEITRRTQGIN